MKKMLIAAVLLLAGSVVSHAQLISIDSSSSFGSPTLGHIDIGTATLANVKFEVWQGGANAFGTTTFTSSALAQDTGTKYVIFGPANQTPTGGTAGASFTYTVVAWDNTTGSTFNLATYRGQSSAVTVTLSNPSAQPPTLAADLSTFANFSLSTVAVPEPSILALGALGLGGLVFRRRKE